MSEKSVKNLFRLRPPKNFSQNEPSYYCEDVEDSFEKMSRWSAADGKENKLFEFGKKRFFDLDNFLPVFYFNHRRLKTFLRGNLFKLFYNISQFIF